MKNVVLFCCKKIRDQSCIGCAKCFKAAQKGAGTFGEPVSIIALTECGDCPGLVMPRVGLVRTILGALDAPDYNIDAMVEDTRRFLRQLLEGIGERR